MRTDALYDSGRTKVAKEEQRICLFNQSNRSIDLNQLISAKRGNSSRSFFDERNIFKIYTFVRAGKQGSNQTAKAMKLRKSNYGGKRFQETTKKQS